MFRQWKRLLFAALISSSLFAATWFWYQSTAIKNSSHSDEKPLAYVGKVVDDIQRRPAARLLWQLVNTGEPLYNGEAIRTSEKGEVRIQFADGDRYLDLEPESLIVIKKSEGEIALDLMEGSLFVNAAKTADAEKAAGSPGLVLNSANGKVDLSQASASLSKGSGNSVDVQVLEGKASVKGKDGQSKELTSGSFGALGANGLQFNRNDLKILSPSVQKPIAMDAEDLKPVHFQWKGFPADSQVSLWIGNSRKHMTEAQQLPAGTLETTANLPFGKHFWKLVAKNPQGQVIGESPIYKTELLARYAPTVVFPTAGAEVPAAAMPFDMTFKWQKGEETRNVVLQVWSDQELTHKIAEKVFTTEEVYTLPGLQQGTYYWRMSSNFVDSEKPVMGKMQSFTVKPAPLVKAEPPPKPSPLKIDFTMQPNQWTQYYKTQPQLNLTWQTEKAEQVASYKIKLKDESDDGGGLSVNTETFEPKLSMPVMKPGRYIASIEAVNKEGEVVGTATSQAVTISPAPLLKAPNFLPAEGPLQAANDGRYQLQWSSVEGAKEYWLTIRKNGKELKKTKYNTTSTSIKNLLPGDYDVEVAAVDDAGRSSEVLPSRKLMVPDKSGVRAPTLKKIKVN
jgi:hypothetical protein